MSDLKGIEYKRFEDIKHIREDGSEYWSAREVGPALDYVKSLQLEQPRNPKKIMSCQDMHVI